jgi:signal transduction histidine kinase
LREGESPETVCAKLMSLGCTIPISELRERVRDNLSICQDSVWIATVKLGKQIALFLEQLIASKQAQLHLDRVARIDRVGRAVLRGGQIHPLKAMQEIAGAFLESAGGEACCLWAPDQGKGSIIPLITSGFPDNVVHTFVTLHGTQSLTARVIQSGKPVHVESTERPTADLDEKMRAVLVQAGVQSFLCSPVRIGDSFVAAVTIYRKAPRAFFSDESDALADLGVHLWDAIAKVELFRTASAMEEVSRHLNVVKDSDALYDELARNIGRWIGARACSIFFREGSRRRIDLRGTTGVEEPREGASYNFGEGLTGWVAREGKSLRIYDCSDEAELPQVGSPPKWSSKVVEKVESQLPPGATRAFLAVPMGEGSRVVGVIRVYVTSTGRPVFSAQEEQLLLSISRQLAMGWDRFRLHDRTVSELHLVENELQEILAVHEAVAKGDSLENVIRLACEKMLGRKKTWLWADLRLPVAEQKKLRYLAMVGPGIRGAIDEISPLDEGASLGADTYLSEGEIYCKETRSEPRFKAPCRAMRRTRSCFVYRLRISHDESGVLSVDSVAPNDFDGNDREYIRLMASQLSVALTIAASLKTLRDAEREKRIHLEGLAHQLVGPLFALRCNCENIVEQRVTVERGKKALVSIVAQSRIAARCAANYGILSDILAGRKPVGSTMTAPCDLLRLAVGIAADYQPMGWLKTVGITVRDKTFGGLPQVAIDDRTFPQVLSNVVENAVKYSDENTVIEIAAERAPNGVTITVTNKGIRLRLEDAERIFERGYRSSEARLRFVPGTGIGLTIARSIVEAHGGTLRAIPTTPDGRTTFVIYMPYKRR